MGEDEKKSFTDQMRVTAILKNLGTSFTLICDKLCEIISLIFWEILADF